MPIATIDQYIGANRQRVRYVKLGALTTVANGWFDAINVAGLPGAGVLAGSSATPGVVPVGGTTPTAGFPGIALGSGTFYLSKIEFAARVPCRVAIFDCLWKGGTYAFNAAGVTVNSADYSARSPGGGGSTNPGYAGLEIWAECVTTSTGNESFSVTYNAGDGTTKTAPATGIGAQVAIAQCWQLPLQAGDFGVKQILTATGSVGTTTGTYNLYVLRPLWTGRVNAANAGDLHDLLRTGMPQIFQNTALFTLVSADSTVYPNPLEMMIEVASA